MIAAIDLGGLSLVEIPNSAGINEAVPAVYVVRIVPRKPSGSILVFSLTSGLPPLESTNTVTQNTDLVKDKWEELVSGTVD